LNIGGPFKERCTDLWPRAPREDVRFLTGPAM
jgi:hypothetical protein